MLTAVLLRQSAHPRSYTNRRRFWYGRGNSQTSSLRRVSCGARVCTLIRQPWLPSGWPDDNAERGRTIDTIANTSSFCCTRSDKGVITIDLERAERHEDDVAQEVGLLGEFCFVRGMNTQASGTELPSY